MKLTLVVYVLLTVSVVGSRRIRHARHESSETAQQEFNLRVQQLNSWTCDVPKPRLVYLDDPANDNGFVAEPNVVWIPVVAVLHRCDQSTGCCSNHPRFTCKPVTTERVRMVFRRLDMLRGTNSYEHLAFTNHTRCNCLESSPRNLTEL